MFSAKPSFGPLAAAACSTVLLLIANHSAAQEIGFLVSSLSLELNRPDPQYEINMEEGTFRLGPHQLIESFGSGDTRYTARTWGKTQTSYTHADSAQAVVQAGAQATPDNPYDIYGSAHAGARAHIVYEAALVATSAPPFPPPSIPINFTLQVGGYALGSAAWSATASVVLEDTSQVLFKRYDKGNWFLPPPDPASDYPAVPSAFDSGTFVIGGPGIAYIILDADCGALASASAETPRSTCGAFIDPVFSFNQELFDQALGEDTYNLSDYFEFVFTPVPAAVPSLHPIALNVLLPGVLAGVALVAMRRRRGRG